VLIWHKLLSNETRAKNGIISFIKDIQKFFYTTSLQQYRFTNCIQTIERKTRVQDASPDLRRLDIKNPVCFVVMFACLCFSSRSTNDFLVSSSFFWIFKEENNKLRSCWWKQKSRMKKVYVLTTEKVNHLSFIKFLT